MLAEIYLQQFNFKDASLNCYLAKSHIQSWVLKLQEHQQVILMN